MAISGYQWLVVVFAIITGLSVFYAGYAFAISGYWWSSLVVAI